jgi:hypothetical protein
MRAPGRGMPARPAFLESEGHTTEVGGLRIPTQMQTQACPAIGAFRVLKGGWRWPDA